MNRDADIVTTFTLFRKGNTSLSSGFEKENMDPRTEAAKETYLIL